MKTAKVSTYRVLYTYDEDLVDDYIQASSAQQAVDFIRTYYTYERSEIIEVAKVVNNWK